MPDGSGACDIFNQTRPPGCPGFLDFSFFERVAPGSAIAESYENVTGLPVKQGELVYFDEFQIIENLKSNIAGYFESRGYLVRSEHLEAINDLAEDHYFILEDVFASVFDDSLPAFVEGTPDYELYGDVRMKENYSDAELAEYEEELALFSDEFNKLFKNAFRQMVGQSNSFALDEFAIDHVADSLKCSTYYEFGDMIANAFRFYDENSEDVSVSDIAVTLQNGDRTIKVLPREFALTSPSEELVTGADKPAQERPSLQKS